MVMIRVSQALGWLTMSVTPPSGQRRVGQCRQRHQTQDVPRSTLRCPSKLRRWGRCCLQCPRRQSLRSCHQDTQCHQRRPTAGDLLVHQQPRHPRTAGDARSVSTWANPRCWLVNPHFRPATRYHVWPGETPCADQTLVLPAVSLRRAWRVKQLAVTAAAEAPRRAGRSQHPHLHLLPSPQLQCLHPSVYQ